MTLPICGLRRSESYFASSADVSRDMRLKSALWVAAYLRRCQVEGVYGVVRRRGAEEAGAVFVRISRLDGTSDLFGPAPQSAFAAAPGLSAPSAPVSPSSRCPMRPSRPILRARSNSIPISGLSKSRIVAGEIFSTWSPVEGPPFRKRRGARSFAMTRAHAGPPERGVRLARRWPEAADASPLRVRLY